MASFNNRLRQVIALHRRSERGKLGAILVRGAQARSTPYYKNRGSKKGK